MSRRTRILTWVAALAALLMTACGYAGDDETDGRKAQAAATHRIVLVEIDDPTVEWAKSHDSAFDGRPIGEPLPDKRFREAGALLFEKILAASPTGLVLDMSFYDNPPEGAVATDALARVLQGAKVPLTLCSPQSAEELQKEIESPVYKDLPTNTQRGHCRMWPGTTSVWTIFLDMLLGQPLSVAAFAASGMGTERAGTLARCLIDETGGIPVKKVPSANIVSGAEVLDGGAVAQLRDAIVLVGFTFTGCPDVHPLLGDGIMRPGVYTHLWTMLQLAGAEAEGCTPKAALDLPPLDLPRRPPPLPD